MSSEQDQDQKEFNLHTGRALCNVQLVRGTFEGNKQNSSNQVLIRRESNPTNNPPLTVKYRLTRSPSTPSINKSVGSNKLFMSQRKRSFF
ncbi:unnamed protein product [Adineta steineri]|uniref:Uncharacterized protein n=1 Tax=Adineta steineri TaxID=433720 RepID=A0A813ZZ37_9BILA|nr:unnamed protein product [Adineta steineri]CAF4067547.1 unnamed protein product [Adineta steineri]